MPDAVLQQVLNQLRTAAGASALEDVADAQLVERFARSRDEAAFALLLRRHGPMALGLGRRLLADEQDAEDVFQAAFLLLARKCGSIRRKQSVASWLHGVVFRLAGKVRAQRLRRSEREREAAAMRTIKGRADSSWRDLNQLLHEVMEKLPEHYRSALVLFHLEGRSHEEAASLLGCPLATLRSRLMRGRKLLECELTRQGVAPTALAVTALLASSATAGAVPTGLLNTTLHAAVTFAASGTASASPGATALVQGALSITLARKVSALGAVALAFVLLGVIAAAFAEREPETATAPTAALDQPAAPGKLKPPDLADIVSASDLILVGSSLLKDPQQTAKEMRFLEVTTLKGPKIGNPQVVLSKDVATLPDLAPGKQWILFLRTNEHDVGTTELYPAASKDWFLPHTDANVNKVKAAMPLPREWGKAVDGLRLGLRLRQSEFKLGDSVVAEVCLQNVSEGELDVFQHRMNIYDYWPDLKFQVTGPTGKKWILEKPAGKMKEADWPSKRILKPGETYIHAVYLNQWPVTDGQIQKRAANLFIEPGAYTITAEHKPPMGKVLKWPRLSAPTVLSITNKGLGQARLDKLLQHLDTAHFGVSLHLQPVAGLWDQRFQLRYVQLGVPLIPREPHALAPNGKPLGADARISKQQAAKLAAILADIAYFDRAVTLLGEAPELTKPFVEISVHHGGANPSHQYRLALPWTKPTVGLLQDLHASVDGEAAKIMGQMIDPVVKNLIPVLAPTHPVPDPARGKTAWGQAVDALQAGVRHPNGKDKIAPGQEVMLELVVRNLSKQPIEFSYLPAHWWGENKNGIVELSWRYIGNGFADSTHIHPGNELLVGSVILGHEWAKLPGVSYSPRPELPSGKYNVGAKNVVTANQNNGAAMKLATGYLDLELLAR